MAITTDPGPVLGSPSRVRHDSRGANSHHIWALRTDVHSQPCTQSCTGCFRGEREELVVSRGTQIELLSLQPCGTPCSLFSQPVFGNITDVKVLPTRNLLLNTNSEGTTAGQAQDLLLLLTDSGNLSVLAFSPFLHRFFSLQQIPLSPPGCDSTSSQLLRVAPDGTAVAVAAYDTAIHLLHVLGRGGSGGVAQHLHNELHAAHQAICSTSGGLHPPVWECAHILSPPLTWHGAAGPLTPPEGAPAASTAAVQAVTATAHPSQPADAVPSSSPPQPVASDTMDIDAPGHTSELQRVTIWDLAFLGHTDTADHFARSCQPSDMREGYNLLALTHKVFSLESTLTCLHWRPEHRCVTAVSRLVLPHPCALGLPTALLPVPNSDAGVVVLGTSSFLLLDCTPMRLSASLGALGPVTRGDTAQAPLMHGQVQGSGQGEAAQGAAMQWQPAGDILEAEQPARLSNAARQAVAELQQATAVVAHDLGPTQAAVAARQAAAALQQAAAAVAEEAAQLAQAQVELQQAAVEAGQPAPDVVNMVAAALAVAGQVEMEAQTEALRAQAWAVSLELQTVQRSSSGAQQAASYPSTRQLQFHSLGSYAEMTARELQRWACAVPTPAAEPAPPQPPDSHPVALQLEAVSEPERASSPPGADAGMAGVGGAAEDIEAGMGSAQQRLHMLLRRIHMRHQLAQAGLSPGEQHQRGTPGVRPGSVDWPMGRTGLRGRDVWPQVVLCGAWLRDEGSQVQDVQGVQRLLLCSSTGQHLCLEVCMEGAAASGSARTDDQHRQHRHNLPGTQLSFRVLPVALPSDRPGADLAASHLQGLPQGALLYFDAMGCARIMQAVVQGRGSTDAGPWPSSDSAGCSFPAVCTCSCITPEAQWAAEHFTQQLQQQIAAINGFSQGAVCDRVPSHVSLRLVASLGGDGVVHDFMLSPAQRSHRMRTYVTSLAVQGGGTLPVTAPAVDLFASRPAMQKPYSQQPGRLCGQMKELHLEVPAHALARWDSGPFPPPAAMWAVHASASHPHDSLLIISFLAATRVLSLGQEMSDVTDLLGVAACEATVAAGLVQEGLMAQVTPTCVHLVLLEPLQQHLASAGPDRSRPAEGSTNSSHDSPRTQQPTVSTADTSQGQLPLEAAAGVDKHRGGGGGAGPAGLQRLPSKVSRRTAAHASPGDTRQSSLQGRRTMSWTARAGGSMLEAAGGHLSSMEGGSDGVVLRGVSCSPAPGGRVAAEDTALASALHGLAVESGDEDMGCGSSSMQSGAMPAAGAAARVLQGGGAGGAWRPECSVGGRCVGELGAGVQESPRILTAAVALGCVVVYQSRTGHLQVLSVDLEGGMPGEGAPLPGATVSGGSGRKRRRSRGGLTVAGLVPVQHEVSCLKLELLPGPLVHPGVPVHAAPTPSSCQRLSGSMQTSPRAYLLLVGHHQPGTSLFQLLLTPGGGVTATLLTEASPPAMLTRPWNTQTGSLGTSSVPHSLELCVVPASGCHSDSTCDRRAAGMRARPTPAPVSQAPAVDSGGAAAAQPATAAEVQRGAAADAEQRTGSRALAAVQVAVQWLVGYRQGEVALYQWAPAASQPPAVASQAAAAAELLWTLDMGHQPVSLALLQSHPKLQHTQLRQDWGSVAGLRWTAGGGGGQGYWPPVVVVGEQMAVASVSPVTNRLAWRQLGLPGPTVSFSCAVSFHAAAISRTFDTGATDSAICGGHGAVPAAGGDAVPLLVTVHDDGSWQLLALAAAGTSEQFPDLQPSTLDGVWESKVLTAAAGTDGGPAEQPARDTMSRADSFAQVHSNSPASRSVWDAQDMTDGTGTGHEQEATGGNGSGREVNGGHWRARREGQAGSATATDTPRVLESVPLTAEDSWVTGHIIPHSTTGLLVLLGSVSKPPRSPAASFDDWLSEGDDDGGGTEQREQALAVCDPDTCRVLRVPTPRHDGTPTHVITWVTRAHRPPTPAGVPAQQLPTSLGAPTPDMAACMAADVGLEVQGDSDQAAAVSDSVGAGRGRAMGQGGDGGSQGADAATAGKEDELVVVAYDCSKSQNKVQGVIKAYRLAVETVGGWQLKLEEVLCAKLSGKVGAVCAPGPECLVASVGRRLVCLSVRESKLVKKGWLATRTVMNQLTACPSTHMVAASDGVTGITLYYCDPRSPDADTALLVVAADTLSRSVTAMCIVPDALLSPQDPRHRSRGLASPVRRLAEPPVSPSETGPNPALFQLQPDGRGNYWWVPQPQEPAAPEAPGALPRTDDDRMASLRRRHALLLDVPVTVVVTDSVGGVALLRAQSLTLSPVRNLQQVGTLHLADRCCQALLATPAALQHPVDMAPESAESAGLLLAGLSGAVYHLVHVQGTDVARVLWLLESCLVRMVATRALSGCNHLTYRGTYAQEDIPQCAAPQDRAVLDGDLLLQYLDLPWPAKQQIARQFLASKGAMELLRPTLDTLAQGSPVQGSPALDTGSRRDVPMQADVSSGQGLNAPQTAAPGVLWEGVFGTLTAKSGAGQACGSGGVVAGSEVVDVTAFLLLQLVQQALFGA